MIDSKKIKSIVKGLQEQEEVRGVIVCDQEGLPIQTTLDTDTAEATAAHITALIGRGQRCVDALKEGALSFLTLETTKGQVMVAKQDELILIVLR